MSKELFNKFASLKGASFIGVNGYVNSHGEVSNQILNVNVSIENAKLADLETLKAIDAAKMAEIAAKTKSPIELVKKALAELVNSAEKNLTEEDRTVSSDAQTDAYISLGKGLRLHKDTMEVYVMGFANSKNVIVEGQYPSTNKQAKTIVKDEIRKMLKMTKIRNMKLGRADALTVTGDTIQIG